MTYIIGYKQPGINTIISDMRVSWKAANGSGLGRNTALKTGYLFPGCFFGRLGSAEHSREFICAVCASNLSERAVCSARFSAFLRR